MRYIAKTNIDGVDRYLTPRRPTGKMYEDRTGWSEILDDAKVFMNRGAATNSARASGSVDFVVLPVSLRLEVGLKVEEKE